MYMHVYYDIYVKAIYCAWFICTQLMFSLEYRPSLKRFVNLKAPQPDL